MAKKKKKVEEQLMLDGVTPPSSAFVEQKIQDEPAEIDPHQITLDDFVDDSILEKDTVHALMKEAVASEQKTTKKKSFITNTIFLIFNIIFMVFIVKNLLDSASGNTSLSEVFAAQGTRMWWILGGLGLLVLFFVCETLLFYSLIKSTTGKKRLGLAYRVASVGKYYDFITPTQLGGQPSQIIRLTKSGVGAGLATSIPIIKLIVYNFVYTIISILLFTFVVPLIPVAGSLQAFLMTLIKIIGAIGLFITTISCFLYFIIGNGKLIGRSLIQWLVRVGYKLHIVKNYRKAFDKLMQHVKEYQSSIKYLNKHKGTLFITVFLCLIECLAFALIPFCVTMAFSNVTLASITDALMCMLITMAQYFLCLLVSTCLPLPGGTGTMEICYIFLFAIGSYSVGENVVWALIFYRILTYYLVLVQGFLHIIIENIVRVCKTKRNNKFSSEVIQ